MIRRMIAGLMIILVGILLGSLWQPSGNVKLLLGAAVMILGLILVIGLLFLRNYKLKTAIEKALGRKRLSIERMAS